MRKMIIILGLISIFFLGVAYAQTPDIGPGYKRPQFQRFGGPGKEFPLTPEQKAKFQELRQNFEKENAQLIGAIVTKGLELKSLWTDPKADSMAILSKEKELRGLINQLGDKLMQTFLEARKFLTPEQIASWKTGPKMCPCGGRSEMW